jgi:hypothetical protein
MVAPSLWRGTRRLNSSSCCLRNQSIIERVLKDRSQVHRGLRVGVQHIEDMFFSKSRY